jgi:hypothetical protein
MGNYHGYRPVKIPKVLGGDWDSASDDKGKEMKDDEGSDGAWDGKTC